MEPFTTLTSVAAPIPQANVDTDVIFPGRFLLITEKAGLGRYAFHDRRWRDDGSPNSDFILNRAPFEQARILVAGDNFGCGSSREQAPWALHDLGIRCVISTRFGEIFRSNCTNNGMLAATVSASEFGGLMQAAERGVPLTVDLVGTSVRWQASSDAEGSPAGHIGFEIAPSSRAALLLGQDEIGTISVTHGTAIAAFEARRRRQMPWLFADPAVANR